jgi:hypothetical protein
MCSPVTDAVTMRFARHALAALAVIAVFAVGAPTAGAQPFPVGVGGAAVAPCGYSTGGPDAGLAGVSNTNCTGGGLVFNGPAVGRIATVIGPTIMSPGFVGLVAGSAGSNFIGPGAGSEVVP